MFNPNESILAGQSQATLRCWLNDAQRAYAELMTGMKVVTTSYDGKSATFTQAEKSSLVNWIELLQAQLGMARRRRHAIRPYFR